jgi:acetylornithine deacetylase
MKKKVMEYIEGKREEMLGWLSEYVKYKSVTGEELEVQEKFILPALKALQPDHVELCAVDKEKKRPNVIAAFKGTGKRRSILFNGHSDVTPIPEAQLKRWTVEPWMTTRKGELVYGHGVGDMKGGITAIFWAVKALRENGVRLGGDVYFESVVGEELMQHELGTTAATKRLFELGYRKIDFCVNPEPSHCEIHTSTPGAVFFELQIPGREIHCCNRNLVVFPQRYGIPAGEEVGVDAIEKLLPFLEFFYRYEKEVNFRWRDKILGGGGYPIAMDTQGVGVFSIGPTDLKGGTYIASVPGEARVTYVVMYPPWETMDGVMAEIKKHIDALASTDDWLRKNPPKVTYPVVTAGWPPNTIDPGHEGPQTLKKSYEEATGKPAIFTGMKAVTDVSFTSRLGIPSVIHGPSDIRMGLHGPDEHMPIQQMIDCAKTYACMILNWSGT